MPDPVKAAPTIRDSGGAKGEVELVELTRRQQSVARRTAESKATIPDFSVTTEVDMEACVARCHGADGPSCDDLVVKAAALALREFPKANGAYRDGRFEVPARVNVGIAVATQDSLVVPTIFDADTKSLEAIAADRRRLAERARDASVTPPELAGGTFTVSSLAVEGVTASTAVIQPSQAAILAAGAIGPQPVARDGAVVVARVMTLTLVCDHRILHGAEAAALLARIKALLEAPAALG